MAAKQLSWMNVVLRSTKPPAEEGENQKEGEPFGVGLKLSKVDRAGYAGSNQTTSCRLVKCSGPDGRHMAGERETRFKFLGCLWVGQILHLKS